MLACVSDADSVRIVAGRTVRRRRAAVPADTGEGYKPTDLAGDKDVLARNTRGLDALSDLLLISVDGSGVNVTAPGEENPVTQSVSRVRCERLKHASQGRADAPVAGPEGSLDGSSALTRRRLPCSETDGRDLGAGAARRQEEWRVGESEWWRSAQG
jgi:hypothetical protein